METFGGKEWDKVEKAFQGIWVCQCGNCLSGKYCEDGRDSRDAKQQMGCALGIRWAARQELGEGMSTEPLPSENNWPKVAETLGDRCRELEAELDCCEQWFRHIRSRWTRWDDLRTFSGEPSTTQQVDAWLADRAQKGSVHVGHQEGQ